ncbi:hypothetical protein D9M68_837670 [compost metagenome]
MLRRGSSTARRPLAMSLATTSQGAMLITSLSATTAFSTMKLSHSMPSGFALPLSAPMALATSTGSWVPASA